MVHKNHPKPLPPGVVPYQARRLCSVCYHRAERNGTLVDYPRSTRARADVVEDYLLLKARSPDMTKARIAAEMGMTHSALDRALVRARQAGANV